MFFLYGSLPLAAPLILKILGITLDTGNIKTGETPLIVAMRVNSRSILLALIEAGADVEYESINGITPLGMAAYLRNQEVIELLLETGTDRTNKGDMEYLLRGIVYQCNFAPEMPKRYQIDKCKSP